MKKLTFIIIALTLLSGITFYSGAQPFTLEIQIKNQPQNPVILGKIKGDKFIPTDSAFVKNNSVQFKFTTDKNPGMYRLIFGQTLKAKIMNEPPQQLDFIFNNEHIIFETDFNAPAESLLIILSEENRVWFEFQQVEKSVQKELNELKMEIDYYQEKANNQELTNRIERYNHVQNEKNSYILQLVEKNQNLLAAKLITMFREPFLDGNLTQQQRNEIYQKEYFNTVEFNDETLINSEIYTDLIFNYLTSYNRREFTNKQRENAYISAIDIILKNTNRNQKVYEFILDYLVHGFEVLKMENVIYYIAENYSETTCQTDEKTTLERKLLSQKMKIGTVVPDFTLNDINSDPVTLSEIQKEKTLLLFWASWCPHCNEMIPSIKNWILKQNTNLEVVVVSLDTSKEEWKKAVASLKIEGWFNLSDLKEWDGKVAEEYNIFATPTMFIIDKNRKILAKPITLNDLIKLSF